MTQVHAAPEIVSKPPVDNFWRRLLGDVSLQGRSDLEKLITGCEIIAAFDDLEMLRD